MGQSKGSSQNQPFTMTDEMRRSAYMQMMGGGGNGNAPYGGVIQQQQQDAPPPPPGTPPPAPAGPANTRYGVWQPSSGPMQDYQSGWAGAQAEQQLGGAYSPNLPWGLSVPVQLGQPGNAIVAEGVDAPPTGLTWDWGTGQVIGGDQQLDAFQDSWQAPGWMNPRPRPTPGMPETIQYGTNEMIPVDPATYALRESAGFKGDNRPGGSAKAGQYPDWWAAANDPNYIQGGLAPPPVPTAPPPAAPVDTTGTGGTGVGRTGYGRGNSGTAGYGSGNPWHGLNGVADAMTRASMFGRRQRG
jgi:hypothetical protein